MSEHKQSRYDKRLILKVVREIEAGLLREKANRMYGLQDWMQDYGSPNYQQNFNKHISKKV